MEKVLPTHDISTAYLHNVANNAQFKYSFLPGVSLEQPDFQTILAAFHLMRCFIVSYGSLNFDGLETIPEDFWISIDKSTDWENLNHVQRDALNKLIKLMTAPDSKFLGVKKEYAAESRKNRASLDSMVTYLDLALTGYSTNDKYGIGLDKILMARMVIPFVKEALRGKVLDIGEIASGVVGPIAAAEVSKEAYNTLGFTKVNFAKIFDLTEGYQKYLPRFTYDEKNPLSLESYYFVDKDGKKTVSFDKIEQLEPEELSKQVYLPDPTVGGVFPDAKTPNPLVSLVAAPGFISLGVVSAFALPEMFGEASKSKAAELATIFAAYQTAQNAYVLMNGTLGAFEVVDFDLPQSDLFIYLPDEEGIMAMSLSDLGKCGAGSSWTLTPIMNEAEIDQWIVLVNNAGGDDSDCMESLIPGLSTLGNVISAKQSVLDPEEGE